MTALSLTNLEILLQLKKMRLNYLLTIFIALYFVPVSLVAAVCSEDGQYC